MSDDDAFKGMVDVLIKTKKDELQTARVKRASLLPTAAQLRRVEVRLQRAKEQHDKSKQRIAAADAALAEAIKTRAEELQAARDIAEKLAAAQQEQTDLLRKLAAEQDKSQQQQSEDELLLKRLEGELKDEAHQGLVSELRRRLVRKTATQPAPPAGPPAEAEAAHPTDADASHQDYTMGG